MKTASAEQGKRLKAQRDQMLKVPANLEGDLLIVKRAIGALKARAHEVSYDSSMADTYVACRAGYSLESISAYVKETLE